MIELDELEGRLRASYRVSLPSAPPSLLRRLAEAGTAPRARARPRLGLLLVPIGVAIVLLAVVFGPGGMPSPSRGHFAMYPVEVGLSTGNVTDVWGIDAGLIAIIWGVEDGEEATRVALSEDDGRTWRALEDPRPGFIQKTGTVVDGTLHLIGTTGPSDDPTWWHVTTDGRAWLQVSEITGLPAHGSNMPWLAHGPLGWVAVVAVDGAPALSVSEDGLDWETPTLPVPAGAGSLHIGSPATDGARFVVPRSFDTGALTRGTEALVSTDLRTWIAHAIAMPAGTAGVVASDGRRFVAAGSMQTESATGPAAWSSVDGSTWDGGRLEDEPGFDSDSPRLVLATGSGFVAIGADHGAIWRSADGIEWRRFAGLPPGESWAPLSAGVRGDLLVVGGAVVAVGGVGAEPVVWIARLSELTAD